MVSEVVVMVVVVVVPAAATGGPYDSDADAPESGSALTRSASTFSNPVTLSRRNLPRHLSSRHCCPYGNSTQIFLDDRQFYFYPVFP